MSNTVEQRTVEMRFDNAQFERNISQSEKSLNNFNNSLGELGGARTGIGAFASTLKGLTFDPINNGIQIGIGKLAALTVALTGISNMANEIYYTTTRLIKSMSFDNVSAGWDKYAQKTTSVQTIMNAVRKNGETAEQTMERVNSQLEKLNWFTDETSYNFTDMVNNIGKFTSQGIDLEKSVTAMQGIATWAAKSGGGVNEASRAMYNLSQAMGVGSVKLMDWRSIENANMATKEFKEQAMEAAVAAGTLRKEGNKYFTKAGKQVGIENFSQTLNYDWFTSDVLLSVLNTYGKYANIVKEAQKDGETAAETMERLKQEGVETMNELGASAFKAAQEAKTFQEAIDATKDAVSTAFLNIFETIFGNYLEAKELWTNFANWLYDVFAAPIAEIADMFKQWKELGNREKLLGSLAKIFEHLGLIIQRFSEKWREVFRKKDVSDIIQITNKIKNFAQAFEQFSINIRHNTKIWENFKTFFTGLKGVIDTFKDILNEIAKRVFPNFKKQGESALEIFSGFFSKIGQVLIAITNWIKKNQIISRTFDVIAFVIGKVIDIVKKFIGIISEIFAKKDKNVVDQLGDSAKEARGPLEVIKDILGMIIDFAGQLMGSLSPLLASVWEFIKSIAKTLGIVVQNLMPIIKGIFDALANVFGEISKRLSDFFSKADFSHPFEVLKNIVMAIAEKVGDFVRMIIAAFSGLKKVEEGSNKSGGKSKDKKSFFERMAEQIGLFAETLMKHKDAIEWMQSTLFNNKDAVTILNELSMGLAKFLIVLAGGTAIILTIFKIVNKVKTFTGWVTTLPETMKAGFNGISKAIKGGLGGIKSVISKFAATKLIMAVGKSLLMIAGALFIVSLIPAEDIKRSLAIVAGALFVLTAAVSAIILMMNKMPNTDSLKGNNNLTSKKDTGPFTAIATFLISIGVSVLLMAAAAAVILKAGDMADVALALGGLLAILLVMTGVVYAIAKMRLTNEETKQIQKVSIAMLLIGMAMKKVAKAIATMAKVQDPESLMVATGMLAAMMGAMVMLAAILSMLPEGAKDNMKAFAKLLLSAAIMLLSVIITIKLMSSIMSKDPEKAIQAMMYVGLIAAGIVAFVGIMTYVSQMVQSGLQVAALAMMALIIGQFILIVLAIAGALKLLTAGEKGTEGIIQAALALVIVMSAIAGVLAFAAVVTKSGGSIKGMFAFAVAIGVMGLAMLALVPAINLMKDLKIKQVGIILLIITGLLSLLVAGGLLAGKVQGAIGGMLAFSTAIVAFGIACLALVPAIALMKDLKIKEVGTILAMIAGLLTLLVAGGLLAGKVQGATLGMLSFSAAIIAFGIACLALVPAIEILRDLKIKEVGTIMAMIAGLLSLLVIGGMITGKSMDTAIGMFAFAGAIAALGIALLALCPALMILKGIGLAEVGSILLVIGGLFTLFLTAGAIIGKFAAVGAGMMTFAVAVAVLGVAVLLAGAGFAAFGAALLLISMGLENIEAHGAGAAEGLKAIFAAVGEGIVVILKSIGLGIIEIFKVFIENKDVLLGMLVNIIEIVFGALIANLPRIFEYIGQLLDGIFTFLETYGPRLNAFITTMVRDALDDILGIIEDFLPRINEDITNMTIDVIQNILRLIEEVIPDLVRVVGKVTLEVTKGIAELLPELTAIVMEGLIKLNIVIMEYLPQLTATAIGVAVAFIVGIIIGIGRETPKLIKAIMQAITDLFNGLAEAIDEKSGELVDAFVNLMQSISDAISENTEKIYDAVHETIETALQSIGYWIGRQWAEGGILFNIGRNIVKGIAAGIRSKASKKEITDAGHFTAKTYMGAVADKNKGMDIQSPSKKMFALGRFAVQGFTNGIGAGTSSIKKAGTGMAQSLLGSLSGVMDSVKGRFSGVADSLKEQLFGGFDGLNFDGLLGNMTDLNPTITPNLDLSEMQKQVGGIDSMFGNQQVTAVADINDWNSAQADLLADQNALDSVTSKNQMNEFMDSFKDYINIQKYNSKKPTNVNVTLQGDASKMLKVLKVEDAKQFKATKTKTFA